jgi:hypothetical protein
MALACDTSLKIKLEALSLPDFLFTSEINVELSQLNIDVLLTTFWHNITVWEKTLLQQWQQ